MNMLSATNSTAEAKTTPQANGGAEFPFQNYGRGTLADLCGDLVLYRSLEPLDTRLPKIRRALYETGLAGDLRPRKQDREYARIALFYAEAARRLAGREEPLQELLFVGDTLYNDGGAFLNMIAESDLRGACFIGVEEPTEEPAHSLNDGIYMANRWVSIADWAASLRADGFQLGENTVVIMDIDKTALGPKGRNDKVIDQARIQGAYKTMTALLGKELDKESFINIYQEINQAKYHAVTKDNQDYLAYICLVITSGMLTMDELEKEVLDGSLTSFDQFTRLVDMRMLLNAGGGEGLRQAHDAVVMSVRNGDPTPFKRFRRQEFVETVGRMGCMEDDAPVADMLAQEITLTEEVYALAEWLRGRGCIVMCLSDKPDEASIPDPRHETDLPPIHKAETHRVGVDIRPALAVIA
ncbi:MAG: hypothetical protein H6642_08225 [Caldilineaceae bacterium]|nr:hypothetical protein [Caldilineaceae bacterium]